MSEDDQSEMGSKDPQEVIRAHEETIENLREELLAVYGVFEFLKTANAQALPKRYVNQWIR